MSSLCFATPLPDTAQTMDTFCTLLVGQITGSQLFVCRSNSALFIFPSQWLLTRWDELELMMFSVLWSSIVVRGVTADINNALTIMTYLILSFIPCSGTMVVVLVGLFLEPGGILSQNRMASSTDWCSLKAVLNFMRSSSSGMLLNILMQEFV